MMGSKMCGCKSVALLILRVVVGIIFIYAGVAKFPFWSMTSAAAGMSASMLMLMKFLAVVETLGGAALILGFMTKWAAKGLGIIMLGSIYFVIQVMHVGFASATSTGWEFNLLLLASSIVLMTVGSGKFSVDAMYFGKDGSCCPTTGGSCGTDSCGSDSKGLPASGTGSKDECCGGNGACGCGK